MRELIAEIHQALDANEFSQNELARRSGVDQKTISNLINNRHSPTLRTLLRLEEGLKALRAERAAADAPVESYQEAS